MSLDIKHIKHSKHREILLVYIDLEHNSLMNRVQLILSRYLLLL